MEVTLNKNEVRKWKRFDVNRATGCAWIGNIPSHWKFMRVKSVAELIQTGTTPSTSNADYFSEDEIPWYGPGSFDIDLLLTCPPRHVSRRALVDGTARLFPSGSILIVTIGATLGKVGYINFAASTNQQITAVSFNRTIVSPIFAAYQLKSLENVMRGIAPSTTIPIMTQDEVGNLPLVLPPLPEQRAIAAFLDRETARIDALIGHKQRLIALLDEKRQAVISQAVTKGIDSRSDVQPSRFFWLEAFPNAWTMTRLKFVAEIQTGLTLGKDYGSRELLERPYLRVANVQDGYLDLREITNVNVPIDDVGRHELQAGDVLMTEGGDFDKLGRGFVWEGQIPGCLHQNHVFAVRPNQEYLLPHYLAALMTSSHGKTYFTYTSQQSTNLASTNSTKLGNFPIPIPTVRKQNSILGSIAERTVPIISCIQRIRQGIASLYEYRTALISAAVTGQIDVREEVQLDG